MKKKSIVILLLFCFVFSGYIGTKEKSFPDFKLISLKGDTISKVDLLGKITVINIWATWCKPCIAEIPLLNKVVDKYKDDKSVMFISLTDENTEKAEKILGQTTFNYQNIANAKTLIGQLQSGVLSVRPQHIMVNDKGLIVMRKSGARLDIDKYLSEEIEKVKASK